MDTDQPLPPMRLRELRVPRTGPHERGLAIGTAFGPEIAASAARYAQVYSRFGADAATVAEVVDGSLQAVQDWAPELFAELAGVAEGAEVDLPTVMSLNARTEVLARTALAARECSTVVALSPDGPPRTLQTWDWYPELAPIGALLELPLPDRVVRTFSEVGMLGKIGTNGRLGLHFNILRHHSDGGSGVPVHLVARAILDRADTVEEAIAIAGSAPLAASTVLTVAQAAPGRAVSIELSPAGIGVVEAAAGYLAHTNHFLDPTLATGEAAGVDSTTWQRLDHVLGRREAVLAARGPVELSAAACGTAGGAAAICVHCDPGADFDRRVATLLTVSLDLTSGAIHHHTGTPAELTQTSVAEFV
ncbi:C45 family autoproteolytic acyltransferase/hydrolase [Naumannella halotolerans]|uniref:C45 family autoproteolytic acyltransferase/hydolase n=1 Tax=Naumannella halotolerans TaxID=993414 RepID=UPI00370DA2CC